MDRREERRDCPTSVVERYAENFHENFSAEMPIKYAPMKKFHLMKVARRRKSALKIFHTSAVRQKTKKAKGKSERREWGVGGRCSQWGVLSATSTGYDKVAHSLPTVTTPRHCLCPLLPPLLCRLATCFNIFGNQTSCQQRLAQIMMMRPKCQASQRSEHVCACCPSPPTGPT